VGEVCLFGIYVVQDWRVGLVSLTFCLRKSKGKKEPARCPFGGVELVSFLPFYQ